MKHHSWFPCLIVLTQSLFAQQQPADKNPQQSVLSYIDADGTAYITRLVNVPETISAEAQKSLVAQHSPPPHPQILSYPQFLQSCTECLPRYL